MSEKNYTCNVRSNYTIPNIDSLRCGFANFAITLNDCKLGYINIILLLIICGISIFGKIKFFYRWFILNQALWDIASSYKYICNSWISFMVFGNPYSTCFYFTLPGGLSDFVEGCIDTNTYLSLLLFSFYRFLGMYYPLAFQRLTTGRKVPFILTSFNVFSVFTNSNAFFGQLYKQRTYYLAEECIQQAMINRTDEFLCYRRYDDFLQNFYLLIINIFSSITFIKPMIFLLGSLIFATMIVVKLKTMYQIRDQKTQIDRNNSVRIAAVIVVQAILSLIVLFLESVQNIPLYLGNTFNFTVIWGRSTQICVSNTNCIYFLLPDWLDGHFGLADYPIRQGIIQLRVFIECLIVFFVMTGYRECIISFIKHPIISIFNGKQINESVFVTVQVQPFAK